MNSTFTVDVTREMLQDRVRDINDRLETELRVQLSDDPFNNELFAYAHLTGDGIPTLVRITRGSRGAILVAIGHVERGIMLGRSAATPNLAGTGRLTDADRREIARLQRRVHIS